MNRTSPDSSISRRASVVMSVLTLLLIALGLRVYLLKFHPSARLVVTAHDQNRATHLLPARRGSIFDSESRLLAGSVERPGIFADPGVIADIPAAVERVAPLVGLNAEIWQEQLNDAKKRRRRFVYLKRNCSNEVAQAVQALKIFGIGVINEPYRNYPQGTLAAHILGIVGRDNTGLEGIELQYERALHGTDGSETLIRDAARRTVRRLDAGLKPPKHGMNLVLTIDAPIQHVTEESLRGACEQYQAESGMAVVMDPRTGDVLAMANWPTFDPNSFKKVAREIRRNRCLTDPVEPGSTLKPLIATAALESGTVSPDQQFDCHNGAIRLGRRVLHDHGDGFGVLRFDEVVVHSSNIGMALIGARMGNALLFKSLKNFGFGSRCGIDLPGEHVGLLLPLHRWTEYSTASIPMGQEIASTAIQLVTAFAALANHGMLLRPRVVRGIIDENGRIAEDLSLPFPRRRVVDVATADYMVRHVLSNVVNNGTGHRAALPNHQVFGKTGTAQLLDPDGRYSHEHYASSFLGGIPASDPQLVVLVMVQKPSKSLGYYGGTVAAPAVRQILETAAAYIGIPRDQYPADGTTLIGGQARAGPKAFDADFVGANWWFDR